MLSPTGLCQAFSAKADGFVRAEGGAVLVLRKAAHAHGSSNPGARSSSGDRRQLGRPHQRHFAAVASKRRKDLLQRVYSRAAIDPNRLAFVEAHGTGTPVGDPIEATALGRSLGHERSEPLPIGSIKTNIGHLEPASGLAGVLKALLALNHGILPPSLHFNEPNPHIEFDRLNLSVCQQSLLLPDSPLRCAGVNSFGFGGTNAHAVVAAGREEPAAGGRPMRRIQACSRFLRRANRRWWRWRKNTPSASRISPNEDTATLASAIVHRRDHLSDRIVISSCNSQDVIEGAQRLRRRQRQRPSHRRYGGWAGYAGRLRLFGQRQPMGWHGSLRLPAQRAVSRAFRRGR